MRVIKLGIISVVVLFVIATAIGLLMPATVRVSRTTSIEANIDTVFNMMNDIKYWKLWMANADTATIIFDGIKTKGPGTVAYIGSNKVSIYPTEKPTTVVTRWQGVKSNSDQYSYMELYHDSTNTSTTIVNWYFEQQLGWYPWERLGSMMNDKILGPLMEQSLDALKRKLEMTGGSEVTAPSVN
ncbi:MAG: hypothetical protein ACK4HE_03055 [Chitinophagaceae bacterium]